MSSQNLKSFSKDESGGTAIEYALIGLLVGLGIIVGLRGLPTALNTLWNNVVSNF